MPLFNTLLFGSLFIECILHEREYAFCHLNIVLNLHILLFYSVGYRIHLQRYYMVLHCGMLPFFTSEKTLCDYFPYLKL